MGHVLCGCPVLLRTQYYARHDAVMPVIYSKLLVLYGFETELKPWFREDYVEKIMENQFCKLFWDFEFQTDSFVKYNKPDIVVMEKITKQILIIEGSTPGDMNLVERTATKYQKYSQLGSELIKLNGMKNFKMIDLVIGATGLVLDSAIKNFKTSLKKIPETHYSFLRKLQLWELYKYSSHFVDLNVLNFNLNCSYVIGNLLLTYT